MKRSSPDAPPARRRLNLMIHAVNGCVPFLTPDMLEKHFPASDDLWIGIAARDTCVVPTFQEKPMKKKKKKGSDEKTAARDPKKPRGYTFEALPVDAWLEPYTRVTVPSFNWMQDNIQKKMAQSQQITGVSIATDKNVSVWTPHGRQKMTPELYDRACSGLKSHYTLSLYDMYEESSDKRREKANTRNKEWFQDLLQRRSEPAGSDDSLWSPVLIPENPKKSALIVSHESVEDVGGVALIGQWQDGLEKLIEPSLSDVPHIALLATYSFSEVLQIIKSNVVDTIGTDLPTRWAKDKLAFAIQLPSGEIDSTSKRLKSEKREGGDKHLRLNADGCLDLKDKAFARDATPLVPGCQCLACANNRFSRAYIHHLVCAKELLAEMLLFGHNLHCLLTIVRACNEVKDAQQFVEAIESQLPSKEEVENSK